MGIGRTTVRVVLALVLISLTTAAVVLAAPARSYAVPAVNGWQVVPDPGQSSSTSILRDVSCPSVTECLAVGSSSASTPLVEQSSGAGWTVDPIPVLPGGSSGALSGLSCPSTSFCIAVGEYWVTAGQNTPLIEEWNGIAWSIATGPTASGGLDRVSCATVGKCIAIGRDRLGNTLTESWSGPHGSV
jgi:hypothetical protein